MNPSVLVVDDDHDAAKVLAEMVEVAGFRSSYVTSGAEALDRLSQTSYDCVLLDINMPHMNGAELALQLRERFGEGLVLVAVTGRDDHSAVMQAAIERTDHFFKKPVKLADLRKLHGTTSQP